jgi:hypothetical protein
MKRGNPDNRGFLLMSNYSNAISPKIIQDGVCRQFLFGSGLFLAGFLEGLNE